MRVRALVALALAAVPAWAQDAPPASNTPLFKPSDGVVLFLTTSPAVTGDGLLLGLGAELERIAP